MDHRDIYHAALGIAKGEAVSELSGLPAVDIHHIVARGMGGTTNPMKNSIFNLMALTREEHEKYGDKKQYMVFLKTKHLRYIMQRGVKCLGVNREVNFSHKGIEFKQNEPLTWPKELAKDPGATL